MSDRLIWVGLASIIFDLGDAAKARDINLTLDLKVDGGAVIGIATFPRLSDPSKFACAPTQQCMMTAAEFDDPHSEVSDLAHKAFRDHVTQKLFSLPIISA